MEFLYTGNYGTAEDGRTKGEEMLAYEIVSFLIFVPILIASCHLDVYAIADLTRHDILKRVVEEKFGRLVKDSYKNSEFPAVAKKAYAVSPPGEQGEKLHQIVVATVLDHAEVIYNHHTDFKAMVEEVAAFGADLSFAMSGNLRTSYFRATRTLFCSYCNHKSYSEPSTNTPEYCPQNCFQYGERVQLSHKAGVARRLYSCPQNHLFETDVARVYKCMYCDEEATKFQ